MKPTSEKLSDPTFTEEVPYRPVSSTAVVALACGVLAVPEALASLDMNPVLFAVLPALGVLLGLRALRAIDHYEMTGRGLARLGIAVSALSLMAGYCARVYRYATEVPPGYARLGYEQLQPGPGESFPESARELDGRKVFIEGYMYPTAQMSGITQFVLCRDNGTCCFGGQPKLTDMVQVTLPAEAAVEYEPGIRSVAGTFRVRPETSSYGLAGVVYHLEGDIVR